VKLGVYAYVYIVKELVVVE